VPPGALVGDGQNSFSPKVVCVCVASQSACRLSWPSFGVAGARRFTHFHLN
jgi:hypothetical protein